MNIDWGSIPAWVWVLLVVAAIVVAPIKLRIWKKLLERKPQPPPED
jgi:hypothetical protein